MLTASREHSSPTRLPHKTLSVSVVIITHGRPERLRACLESLAACSAPAPREIIVVLNGKDAVTARWLEASRPQGVRWLESTPASKGRARNRGAAEACGEHVFFLDDDVTVPPSLFLAVERHLSPEVDVLGGPNLTPSDSTPFQRSVGFSLQSWLGAGTMSSRYNAMRVRPLQTPSDKPGPGVAARQTGTSASADDRCLMLCNLLVRRRFFQSGLASFPTDFFYNEENVLLESLRRQNAVMRYSPELAVHHARRNGWGAFVSQVWRSGVGRGHMTRLMPRSCRWEFLAPLAFLIYMAALPLLPLAAWAPLFLYIALTAAEAARAGRRERSFGAAGRAAGLIAAGHAAYGIGFLAGFIRPKLNSPS